MVFKDTKAWEFCWAALQDVSRTFFLPISCLQSPLREWVTVNYLFCRILDTIEDDPHLSEEFRVTLYRKFILFLKSEISEEEWLEFAALLSGKKAEITLAQRMSLVLLIFHQMPKQMQSVSLQWIYEMCQGMQIYSHRPRGEHGLRELLNLNDLHRYCYFVAGTVGHLLTELFIFNYAENFSAEVQSILRCHGESYGVGLQLVNILKDVHVDLQNQTSFIPKSLDFFGSQNKSQICKPIIDLAYQYLEHGLEYTLAVPQKLIPLRLFLLIPLWIGHATLNHLQQNNVFENPDIKVAISRSEVTSLVQECQVYCQDNHILASVFNQRSRRHFINSAEVSS